MAYVNWVLRILYISCLIYSLFTVEGDMFYPVAEEVEGEGDNVIAQEDGQQLFQGQVVNPDFLSVAFPSLAAKKKSISPAVQNLESQPWHEFEGEVDKFLSEALDPGSWRIPVVIPQKDVLKGLEEGNVTSKYLLGMKQLLGTPLVQRNISLAIKTLAEAAGDGLPSAQSALAFIHSSGFGAPVSFSKSFLYHTLAADGGSYQSEMALAYQYARQQEYVKAVDLYARVAAKSIATNHVLRTAPLVETVKLNLGGEEDLQAIRGHRGEEDDTIQYVVYSAKTGNVPDLRALGNLYYWGARGLNRDHKAAFGYYKKAADQKDPISMAALGEMYIFGLGVEKNYPEANRLLLEATKLARRSSLQIAMCSKGLGYLHALGLGVPRNYTHALVMFKLGAQFSDPDSQYYLGVMYLRGLGTPKNLKAALQMFALASNANHLAATYQLAKLHHHGLGTQQNILSATILYKAVAERGPWGSLLRWAHLKYLERDIESAYLLYSRAAELGYEVAQSNAGWILDRFQKSRACVGPTGGLCSEEERHERENRLWKLASEQGNVQAALLLGDAHYYGKGTKRDLGRAAEAYRIASDKGDAQAKFNLGYMHEHGEGLPMDYHLAKRMYDDAFMADSKAELPVRLALLGLQLRQLYPNNSLSQALDTIPEYLPDLLKSVRMVLDNEANVALMTLLALLGTVVYLRGRTQRQNPVQPQAQQN